MLLTLLRPRAQRDSYLREEIKDKKKEIKAMEATVAEAGRALEAGGRAEADARARLAKQETELHAQVEALERIGVEVERKQADQAAAQSAQTAAHREKDVVDEEVCVCACERVCVRAFVRACVCV